MPGVFSGTTFITQGTPTPITDATTAAAIAPNNPQVLDAGSSINAASAKLDALQAQFNGQPSPSVASSVSQNNQSYPTPANSGFDARLASMGLSWSPSPNALNDYANYTYHIRWFMTTEAQAYNNLDTSNPNSNNMTKTVIAESGVTAGFNIVELLSKSSTTSNKERRNMWSSTTFEMTLTEPLGMTLMDKIYFSSKQIGVINHARCPYFLEIWFNGYNEDGTIMDPGLFYQMYRVKIIKMEVNATHVGSTYNIHFAVDNAFAEMNTVAIPQAGFNIRCSNLGQFFDSYADALNKQQDLLNNDGIRRVNYKFIYPDIWKQWNMRPADTDKHVSRSGEMRIQSSELKDQTVLTINKGQAVENVVNFAVYLCKDAQAWITGDSGAGAGGASLAEQAIIGYVSVYPIYKITGYDPVTKDYIYEITYVLTRTESTRAYTDMQSVNQAQLPSTQTAKLQYLIQNGRLAKRYDYIYTGLNTEVVSFDIKMDLTWAINLPSWNQGNSYYQYATPALANTNSQDFQKTLGLQPKDQTPPDANQAAALDRLLSGVANSSSAGQPVGAALGALQQTASGNPGSAAAAATNPPTSSTVSAANNRIVSFNQSSGQQAVEAAQSKIPGDAATTGSAKLGQTAAEASRSTTYIEDTKNNTALFSQPPLPIVGTYDTQPSAQNATQNADQAKTANVRDPQAFAPGVGFVGAVLGNLFDNRAFNEIDVVIRGDPWWIPQSNITQNQTILNYTNNQTAGTASSTQTYADYLGGDNSFLLEFKTGVVIDEATGLAKDDTQGGSDFFTGIYLVMDVTNSFSHGKFTQTLHAFKDVLSQNPISTVGSSSSRQQADRASPYNVSSPTTPATAPQVPDGAVYGPGGLSG